MSLDLTISHAALNKQNSFKILSKSAIIIREYYTGIIYFLDVLVRFKDFQGFQQLQGSLGLVGTLEVLAVLRVVGGSSSSTGPRNSRNSRTYGGSSSPLDCQFQQSQQFQGSGTARTVRIPRTASIHRIASIPRIPRPLELLEKRRFFGYVCNTGNAKSWTGDFNLPENVYFPAHSLDTMSYTNILHTNLISTFCLYHRHLDEKLLTATRITSKNVLQFQWGHIRKLGAVSCVGIDFPLIQALYLVRTWLVMVQFTQNKKCCLSWLNL